jgi:dihydropteroate synthase
MTDLPLEHGIPPSRSSHVLSLGSKRLELGTRTAIMGIVNVTPDSFSDGGSFLNASTAVAHALRMAEEGADLIDVGGQSTRPGARPVPEEEELARVLPVIEKLHARCPLPLSIDTSKSRVAREALAAGAALVNDVTALRGDPHMLEVVSDQEASVCLMHMRGDPENMQKDPSYRDVVSEVRTFLRERASWALSMGVREDRILVDPGIGFGKTLEHNLCLMAHAGLMGGGRFPVLIGPSRKAFIGHLLDLPVTDRLEGTLGAVIACRLLGAHMVRVHDVRAVKRAMCVADEIAARRKT